MLLLRSLLPLISYCTIPTQRVKGDEGWKQGKEEPLSLRGGERRNRRETEERGQRRPERNAIRDFLPLASGPSSGRYRHASMILLPPSWTFPTANEMVRAGRGRQVTRRGRREGREQRSTVGVEESS